MALCGGLRRAPARDESPVEQEPLVVVEAEGLPLGQLVAGQPARTAPDGVDMGLQSAAHVHLA